MILQRTTRDLVSLMIDRSLYSEKVIYNCFYWYGDLYAVTVTLRPEQFLIELKKKEGELTDDLLEHLLNRVKTDLIDFKTREIISNETRDIKNVLIAKAFSKFDDFDEQHLGSIQDPVRFDLRS
jgi:His-Xaa-Ser system protein HxsD